MASKNRKKKSNRKYGGREVNKLILIVCEGKRTEPNYFRGFQEKARASKIEIKIKGEGYNTLSLVKEAMRIEEIEGKFDRVWCVFDKDSFSQKSVLDAFALASKNENYKIAFSNEAFALWYLLHFDYIVSALSRNQFRKKLTKRLGRRYKKNDETMYKTLLDKQSTAIRNAKRLLSSYPNKCDKTPCPNPSTTVVYLVEELNEEIQKYINKSKK